MAEEESISGGTFAVLAVGVLALAVGIPVVLRRPAQPDAGPAATTPESEAPPPVVDEEPLEQPLPPPAEEKRGEFSYDAENGWFEFVDAYSKQKQVVPVSDVLGVEPAPGREKQEFMLLRNNIKVRVPPGFVTSLPRDVRYKFDYGRSGNVDPKPDSELR